MNNPIFSELEKTLAEQGVARTLDRLADHLLTEKKYHDLFDVRLMQGRVRLGLPAVMSGSLDQLTPDVRTKIEAAYLAACEEAGQLLLDGGKLREAWMYFQPSGKSAPIADAIRQTEATQENLEELIELSLGHRIAPILGYKLILENYGVCNAITSFDREIQQCSPAQQQEAAKLLVENLHRELIANVKADIQLRNKENGSANLPVDETLAKLIAGREDLFENGNYHSDVSHIHSVIRIARCVAGRGALELAADICEYGRKLASELQSAGDAPFEELYLASQLFFNAQLGKQVGEAVEYFTKKAEATDVYSMGTGPAETLIVLLSRVGKSDAAIAASIRWIPPGTHHAGFAPSLFELSRQSGHFSTIKHLSEERGDLVNYAAALATEHESKAAGKSP